MKNVAVGLAVVMAVLIAAPMLLTPATAPAAEDLKIALVVPLSGRGLHHVVNLLAGVERVQERGQRAEVQRRGPDAEQVVADAGQFRQDGAEVLAPRRQLDAH